MMFPPYQEDASTLSLSIEQPGLALTAVPWKDVTIDDLFWATRLRANREHTLPHLYRFCQETGRLDAFRLDWKPGREPVPHIFWDSDVAKWLEAAFYSLATHPDAWLSQRVDEVVALILAAHQPDGYLNTHFTAVEPEKRQSPISRPPANVPCWMPCLATPITSTASSALNPARNAGIPVMKRLSSLW